jgi:hypothetical protein
MMLTKISIFCESDVDVNPQEDFPHEYSAYVPGGPATYYRKVDDLKREKYTGVEENRTVTTEGLQAPVHAYLNVQPPKYPPAKLTGYDADHSIIAAIDGTIGLLVYSIDTVDPDDYDSLPAAMQGMRPDDPIKEGVWTPLRNGLITITPTENQDQVTTALDNWREQNPLGTATEFAIALRIFTS